MTKKSLYKYKEARLTPCMINIIIVGSIIFTIIMMIIMQVPSLA